MTSLTSTTPTAPYTTTRLDCEPSEFTLPNLLDDCPYPLRENPHCDQVSRASERWLLDGARLVEPHIAEFMRIDAGTLAAACYPDADAFHLRVITDFLNFLFTIDDWMEFGIIEPSTAREGCMSAYRDPINFSTEELGANMCKSYFSRFRETGGPGCTKRFIHTMDMFFIAVAKQVDDHANECSTRDLKSYITMRRDTSTCKPCFALIEYALQIDLPDEVTSHSVIVAMEEATNDYICFTNDIVSYNKEQSTGHDTHNVITVLMHARGLDLQSAVDYANGLCASAIQRFDDHRAILPTWGEDLDKQVAMYIEGLQNCMVGALHWHFGSSRYSGQDGHAVKRDQIIKLLPKCPL